MTEVFSKDKHSVLMSKIIVYFKYEIICKWCAIENNNYIMNLEQVMRQNNLFQKYHLNRVGIFGSVARGEESNDIDILIEDDINYRELAQFRNELEVLLNKRVDLVMLKYANPIVLYRAKKDLVYVLKR